MTKLDSGQAFALLEKHIRQQVNQAGGTGGHSPAPPADEESKNDVSEVAISKRTTGLAWFTWLTKIKRWLRRPFDKRG
jgi:hypothetical protein